MTRDDVIRMAREAAGGMLSYDGEGSWRLSEPEVERFAALVAAAEREACAQVCESEWSNVAERMYGDECAAAIRARKEKT